VIAMTVVGLVPAYATALSGQVIQSAYDPRDDQYRILGLVRAQAEYERAAAEHERGVQLFERGLISEQELADLRQSFERACAGQLPAAVALGDLRVAPRDDRSGGEEPGTGREELRATDAPQYHGRWHRIR
jgi:hypothetical protein